MVLVRDAVLPMSKKKTVLKGWDSYLLMKWKFKKGGFDKDLEVVGKNFYVDLDKQYSADL